MQKLKPKKVDKLLKNNSLIANSVTEKLYLIKNLEIFLYGQLDEDIRSHVKPLNARGSWLVLAVDSAALKARLRYQLPELEKQLQLHTQNKLKRIEVKVRPISATLPTQNRPGRKSMALSEPSKQAITKFADNLSDSRLKKALLRLASRSN
jgi:hypothetical protein